MLHNLDARTTYTINSAFWTLAIEEQLYLAYFLLLYLRIRYGWARTLLVCVAARVVWLGLGRGLVYFAGVEIPVSEARQPTGLSGLWGRSAWKRRSESCVCPRGVTKCGRALSRYCWRWVSRSGCRRLIIWRGFTMPAGC